FSLLTESGDHLIVSEGADSGEAIPPGDMEELYEYDYENRLVKPTKTVGGLSRTFVCRQINEALLRCFFDFANRRPPAGFIVANAFRIFLEA
ncbi:MAG: hypothetical protein LBD30_03070, partial [Verrucomicrobiales bacterium]|nr:hypothetical protein [Verrucomicrobiales bacterium]